MADKPETTNGPEYSGKSVRQGEIVLNSPLRRRIFVGGLVGVVVLAIALGLAAA